MEATGSQHMRTRVGVTSAALSVPAATAPCQENHKIKFSIKKCLGRSLCQSGEGCPCPRGLEQDACTPTAICDTCLRSSSRGSLSSSKNPSPQPQRHSQDSRDEPASTARSARIGI